MRRLDHVELIQEGEYLAKVPIQLIPDDGGWGPYLSPEDLKKLETVRAALKCGDLAAAMSLGHVFRCIPVDVQPDPVQPPMHADERR